MKFSLTDPLEVRKFFFIFYIVGTIGMCLPWTFPIFVKLIPLALVLNLFYLIYFHKDKKNLKDISLFVLIFILGFGIEVLGVKTGKIFGVYYYGSSMGPKLMEVPLTIGFNWLILTYTTASLSNIFRIPTVFKILLGALMMLALDLILELAANSMDMWYWPNNEQVPLQNYLVWFSLAVLFHIIFRAGRIRTENKLAIPIFICQFLLFAISLLIKTLIG